MGTLGRFDQAELMVDVMARIDQCAEAAAMATETGVDIELITATHDKNSEQSAGGGNETKNLKEIGAP